MLTFLQNHSKWTKIGLVSAFLLGLMIRIIQFVAEPSMWKDELFSVVNIEKMSFWELLTQQPEYNQVAGVGFYIIQKTFYSLLGSTEMAFRLYPFIASICSMWIFYLIAKRFLSGTKLVMAVFLMSTALGPWFQSFNAKPYSGDILFSMFFVWIGIIVLERQLSNKELWIYGFIGFIGTIASLPGSIIALVLIAVTGVFQRKQLTKVLNPMFLLWAIGALWNIVFAKFVIQQEVASAMAEHHSNSFPPAGILDYLMFFPSRLANNLGEFITIGTDPFNLVILGRSILIFVLTAIVVYVLTKQKKKNLLLIVLPIAILLGLTACYILPMSGRTAYYGLWPFLLLPFIGLSYLQQHISWIKRWLSNTLAIIIVLPSILIVLLGMTALPFSVEPIKKVLHLYNQEKQEGDILYVQGCGELYMTYYGPKYGVEDYIVGHYDYDISKEEYVEDLEQLEGNDRVWLLFTGLRPEMGLELNAQDFKDIFLERAKLLKEYPIGGSYPTFLNLYDFSTRQ